MVQLGEPRVWGVCAPFESAVLLSEQRPYDEGEKLTSHEPEFEPHFMQGIYPFSVLIS